MFRMRPRRDQEGADWLIRFRWRCSHRCLCATCALPNRPTLSFCTDPTFWMNRHVEWSAVRHVVRPSNIHNYEDRFIRPEFECPSWPHAHQPNNADTGLIDNCIVMMAIRCQWAVRPPLWAGAADRRWGQSWDFACVPASARLPPVINVLTFDTVAPRKQNSRRQRRRGGTAVLLTSFHQVAPPEAEQIDSAAIFVSFSLPILIFLKIQRQRKSADWLIF